MTLVSTGLGKLFVFPVSHQSVHTALIMVSANFILYKNSQILVTPLPQTTVIPQRSPRFAPVILLCILAGLHVYVRITLWLAGGGTARRFLSCWPLLFLWRCLALSLVQLRASILLLWACENTLRFWWGIFGVAHSRGLLPTGTRNMSVPLLPTFSHLLV